MGIEGDIRWFEKNRQKLADKYEGIYVAVINHKVVDADNDFSKLVTRIYTKYGYKAILMKKVYRVQPIYRMRSPKFIIK